MKILVTGGTGFLGLYIVERLLARGEEVRIFARHRTREIESLPVEFFQGDLFDRDAVFAACEGMDVVFHTAARTGLGLRFLPFYRTNVVGTVNVLNGCRKAGVGRLIYTGSPSVTDAGKPLEGIDETTPYPVKFIDAYPQSKAIAERFVLSANGEKLEGGGVSPSSRYDRLLTCSIRPRLIWGPRDRQLIPRLIQFARKGKLAQIGDGTNRLDVTYVENAADAHLAAMDRLTPGSPVAGSAYFISQGEPVNCWEWINRLLSMIDLPPIRKRISFKTAYRIGFLYELFYRLFRFRGEPPMTRFLANQLAQSYWFDISKARRELGYEPRISTEEGLRRLAEDLRKTLEGKAMGD